MQKLLYPRNLPQPSRPSPDLQKDQACTKSRFYALNIRGAYSASCSALCPDAATTHPWRSREKDVMHRCGSLHTGSSQNSKPSSQPTSVVTVQSLSHLLLFGTLWPAAHQVSLSFTTAQSFLKLMSINSVMQPSYLILWHPLLLLPSIFPSIRVFSSELVLCIRWPKDWNFSIDPSC